MAINYFILKAALNEGFIRSIKEIGYFFVLGATSFALFEFIGPVVMQITLLLSVIYYFFSIKYLHR